MRKYVYLLVIAAMVLVAACNSQPQAAEPTAAPAAESGEQAAAPAESAPAEAPAEAPAAVAEGEVVPAVAYPEGQAVAGGAEAVKFALDEIYEVRALDSYCEPEWVTELVEQGKLPPIEERLPKEPWVYKEGFPSTGPGEYGGIWRGVWAANTEGWNFAAGVSQGWFGIEAAIQEEPFATGPMFLTQDVSAIPQLVKSYEWNDDNTVLTLHFLEGVKWSDGVEFTTEDMMFLWEDNIMDENISTWTGPTGYTYNGELTTLEAPDAYTLVFTLPEPDPRFLYKLTNLNFSPGPAHILKPLHPKYGGSDYQSYRDSLAPGNLPAVVLGPWVPVQYTTDEFMLMRRNPYYYKVDANGCQLPYLDEVQWTFADTGATRTLNTIAGTADHANVENFDTMDETVRQAANPDASFRVEWGPETLGFAINFNQSEILGVANDRDRAVRDLLRDPDFRKAMAYAIDREGLAKSLTNGPFFRAWAGGIYPGSGYFDRESVVFYPYSPESANILLDGLGLVDTNGDGVREFPAGGPAAGENIVIGMTSIEDNGAGQILGPAITNFLAEVGIQANLRLVTNAVGTEQNRTGTWEMQIDRMGQEWAAPNFRCRDIAPVNAEFGPHRVGQELGPNEFADYEQRMVEIALEFCLANNFEDEMALMSEFTALHTENVANLGLVVGRYGLMLNKNFQNVPVGTPAFLYQWDFNNFLPEQIWLEESHRSDQGQSEIYPGSVPNHVDCDYMTSGNACLITAD